MAMTMTVVLLFARLGTMIYGCDISMETVQTDIQRMWLDPQAANHPSRQPDQIQ